MNIQWCAWLVAFSAATVTGPVVILFYRWLGWIDDPSANRVPKTVHTHPVPRGGGIVVALGILAALWFIPLTSQIVGIFIGAGILLLSGTLDDRYDLNPYLRYALNIVATLCVILSGVGIAYVTNPLGAGVLNLDWPSFSFSLGPWQLTFSLLADILALLWIVWNMNAVNWSKGIDGQLPGFTAIAAFFIALLSLRFEGDTTQGVVTLLALAVSGAYAGLLVWNRYPQRMMPGYAAGSLAGFFLAVLAILGGAKVATALLLLAVPTLDGIFTILRRLAHGRNPFWGDRGHLHHRLLDAGWSKPYIAGFYWLLTIIFGILALQLDSKGKLYVFLATGILFLGLLLWLKRSIFSSVPPGRGSGLKT